jgi:hypothetical protein
MSAWLLIGISWAALWILWQMLNLVSDMLEHWYAARRGEAMSSYKERERFLS